ncbi:MAG: TerB family tellurite resistance protein [Robiginitalea sp.]
MPIIDLYKHGEGRSNLAHFAALASLANLDGIITKEEGEILDYFAAKLGITEAEYREVMKEENKYPIETPLSHKERMERLFDFFRVIISDLDLQKAQLQMVETYAIALGFSPANAKKVVDKSIKIFSGQISLQDYMYLMER